MYPIIEIIPRDKDLEIHNASNPYPYTYLSYYHYILKRCFSHRRQCTDSSPSDKKKQV